MYDETKSENWLKFYLILARTGITGSTAENAEKLFRVLTSREKVELANGAYPTDSIVQGMAERAMISKDTVEKVVSSFLNWRAEGIRIAE